VAGQLLLASLDVIVPFAADSSAVGDSGQPGADRPRVFVCAVAAEVSSAFTRSRASSVCSARECCLRAFKTALKLVLFGTILYGFLLGMWPGTYPPLPPPTAGRGFVVAGGGGAVAAVPAGARIVVDRPAWT